jgi:hypothetical protein
MLRVERPTIDADGLVIAPLLDRLLAARMASGA